MTIKTWLQIGPTSDFHIFTCANSEIDKNSADDMSTNELQNENKNLIIKVYGTFGIDLA